jgi:hypothetical protein
MENVGIARDMIIAYLGRPDNVTQQGLLELLEIQSGNKEILLGHIKAVRNIFTDAIQELEKEDEKCKEETN